MSGLLKPFTIMLALALCASTALAQNTEFPFGLEMTLDVAPMRGSKRIPRLEIGESGEVKLDLWCKSAQGQLSVANETVMFIPGAIDAPSACAADRARADDALLEALAAVTAWKRHGDFISFVGPRTLRFHLNTN